MMKKAKAVITTFIIVIGILSNQLIPVHASEVEACTSKNISYTTIMGYDAICIPDNYCGDDYYIKECTMGNNQLDQITYTSVGTTVRIVGNMKNTPNFGTVQGENGSVNVCVWPDTNSDGPELSYTFDYQDARIDLSIDCSSLNSGIHRIMLYFNWNCSFLSKEIYILDGSVYFGEAYSGLGQGELYNYNTLMSYLQNADENKILNDYLSDPTVKSMLDAHKTTAMNFASDCNSNYEKALEIYKYFENHGSEFGYDEDIAMAMLGTMRIPAINTSLGIFFYSDGWYAMDVRKVKYINCLGYFDMSDVHILSLCDGPVSIEEYEVLVPDIDNNASTSQTEQFVTRLYNKCLGREPEPSGLDYWNQILVNRERSGAQVAYGFVFSKEYTAKNTSDEEYVIMLYNVFLDRVPDASGKEHWLGVLKDGVSREYVFRGFVHSQEYADICNLYGITRGNVEVAQPRDKNINITRYVNRMYEQALGRMGEESGLNHWCETIQTGVKTPEQVAEAFINSEEFRNKNLSDEEYIKVLYRAFMGREYDQEGLEHWIGELERGCSREEILHRFATSQEFHGIISSFGI